MRPAVLRCRRLRRTVTAIAAGVVDGLPGWRAIMVTLTYAPGSRWEPWHVSAYLAAVHAWARRQSVTLPRVWVAEIQLARYIASGCSPSEAVHFHVLFWLPARLSMPKADNRGWWPHGMTRTERARNPVGYVAKYASKGDPDVVFPRGLRAHGSGGLSPRLRTFRSWWALPLHARAKFAPGEKVKRCLSGVVSLQSGEISRSPLRAVLSYSEGVRYLWMVPREPFTQSDVNDLHKGYILSSRELAKSAGYHWLRV